MTFIFISTFATICHIVLQRFITKEQTSINKVFWDEFMYAQGTFVLIKSTQNQGET